MLGTPPDSSRKERNDLIPDHKNVLPINIPGRQDIRPNSGNLKVKCPKSNMACASLELTGGYPEGR